MQFNVQAGVAAAFGAEARTGLLAVRFNRGIRILDMKQVTGAAAANDADWTIWVDRKDTGITIVAPLLNPVNVGAKPLFSTPLRIQPNVDIQFAYVQAVAQANVLNVEYEEV